MSEEQRAELEMYRAITRKQNALLDSRLRGLEDRVAELEARIPAPEIVTRAAKESPTHDGRIVVDANEWERLAELEKAAREFIQWLPYHGTAALLDRRSSVIEPIIKALR